jgi:DNA processing protein
MDTATLSPDEPAFPSVLRDLPRHKLAPCKLLRIRGRWPAAPGVAIVGTREPTEEGLAFTRSLAAAVVGAGWAVWSGGARGIDAEAHEEAMARGGRTVVVCPSGLDRPYPAEHRGLFARVVERGGTLVSPFEDDEGPELNAFYHRNAVLAALSIATVVVQAPKKSGARSTANAARKLGKPLLVVPHAPWEEKGLGCALELQIGARAIADAQTILFRVREEVRAARQLSMFAPAARRARSPSRGASATSESESDHALARERSHAYAHTLQELDEIATRVFQAIGEMPVHTDDLCERTMLPFAAVAAALLTLTLGAVVVEAPAGYYRRNTP